MPEFSFGRVEWDVEPNTTGFGRRAEAEIKAQTEGLSTKVEVEPNTRGLAATLRRQLKEAVTAGDVKLEVPVSLKINRTQLRADQRVIQDQLDANRLEIKVGVKLSETEIRAELRKVEVQAKEIKAAIPVKVSIDRNQIRTDLRVIQEQVKASRIDLKLGVKVTQTDLRAELRRVAAEVKAAEVKLPLTPTISTTAVKRAIRDLELQLRASGVNLRITPELGGKATFVAEVRKFIREVELGLPHLTVKISSSTTGSSVAKTIGRDLSAARKPATELDDNLRKIARSAGAITGPLGGAGSQFARLANSGSLAAAALGGLGVAFAGIIGFGAKLAAEGELADKGIVALTKSAGFNTKQAKGFITQLEQFAAVTPFEVPQVKSSAKFLLGAGFKPQQILPQLQVITDVGAILGSSTTQIENVAKAIAKIQGKGTAQLLELNQIRRNLPGFDPVKAIADFKGQTIAQTYLDISKKAIPAQLAIVAINQALAKFPGAAGAAGRAAQTLTGLFSTLKDEVKLGFKDAFLQPQVLNPLKGVLRDLIKGIRPQIAEEARNLAPIIGAIGPALKNGIVLFLEITKAAAPFFTKLLEGTGVLELKLIPAFQSLRPVFSTLGSLFKDLVPIVSTIISLMSTGLSVEFRLFSIALSAVNPLLQVLNAILTNLPGPIQTVLGLFILLNRETLFAGLKAVVPFLKDIATNLLSIASLVGRKFAEVVTNQFPALASAGEGILGFFKQLPLVANVGIAAVVVGLTLLAAAYARARADAQAVVQAGKEAASGLLDSLNDLSKVKFQLSDVFDKILGDSNSALGKIFQNNDFQQALQARNETVHKYAVLLSRDSKTAFTAFVQLAGSAEAQHGVDFFGRIARGIGAASDDLNAGIDRLETTRAHFVTVLRNTSGPGADIIKKSLKAQSDALIAQGKFEETVTSFDAKGRPIFAKLRDEHGKAIADQALLAQKVAETAKRYGISIDLATGKTTQFDQATTDLAVKLNLSLEAVDAFQKDIKSLSDTIDAAFSAIRGSDVIAGPNGFAQQLGGASQAIVSIINQGGDLTEGLTGIVSQLGLSDTAAQQFLTTGINFAKKYIADIGEVQAGFKGLIPTISSVFDELKSKAGDVAPTYDQLLKGLQKKLEESAAVTDNLGKILRRGGSGIIETLKTLPPEAQAAYAAAIADASDKTFVKLEAKAEAVNRETQQQISNQGLIAIAAVNGTVDQNVQVLQAAQTALADIAKQTRAQLTEQMKDPTLSPGQRRLLADDREHTTAASVAQDATQQAIAATATTVSGITAQLALVPPAAQKANDQAVASLGNLGTALSSTVVPGLQTFASESTVDLAKIAPLFLAMSNESVGHVLQMGLSLDTAFTAALDPINTFAGDIVIYSDGITFNVQNLADTMIATIDLLPTRMESGLNRSLDLLRQFADAINSVTSQVGGTKKIDVPHIGVVGVRVPTREVRHSGGIIGDGNAPIDPLDGPLLPNEKLVKAQLGEGMIPTDVMKQIGLPQFEFIRKGDIAGLLRGQAVIPAAKASVIAADKLAPAVSADIGGVVGPVIGIAIHELAGAVTSFLTDADALIDHRLATAWGFTPGKGVGGDKGLAPLTALMGDLVRSMIPGTSYISTVRPGAVTAHTHNVSLHASGHAIDFGGNLPAIYAFLADRFAQLHLRELIFQHKIITPSRGLHNWPWTDHFNHVHAGTYANGDIVNRPTLALWGEAGREMRVPLSDRKTLMKLLLDSLHGRPLSTSSAVDQPTISVIGKEPEVVLPLTRRERTTELLLQALSVNATRGASGLEASLHRAFLRNPKLQRLANGGIFGGEDLSNQQTFFRMVKWFGTMMAKRLFILQTTNDALANAGQPTLGFGDRRTPAEVQTFDKILAQVGHANSALFGQASGYALSHPWTASGPTPDSVTPPPAPSVGHSAVIPGETNAAFLRRVRRAGIAAGLKVTPWTYLDPIDSYKQIIARDVKHRWLDDILTFEKVRGGRFPLKGFEFGDLIRHEQIAKLGERNQPELVLPLSNGPRTEDLLARWIFDPTVSNVNAKSLMGRLESLVGNGSSTTTRDQPAIHIEPGGSLISVHPIGMTSEVVERELAAKIEQALRGILN